jgi:hypothetical protein
MGYQAGYSLRTLSADNIFIGFKAGYAVQTGTGNIVIGYNKDTSLPTANNELNIGGVLYGDLSAKTIGISTRIPSAALDVVSTGTADNQMAQIWRASDGVIRSSMSATGVLMAFKFIGDGSGLTGVIPDGAVLKAGDVMTGQLTVLSSVTIQAAAGRQLVVEPSGRTVVLNNSGAVPFDTAVEVKQTIGQYPRVSLGMDNGEGFLGLGSGSTDTDIHWARRSAAGDLALLFGSGTRVERMRITSSGNVGIATGVPQGLFDVMGGSFVVKAGGKVGVGTANPASILEVVDGSITISGVDANLVVGGNANRYISDDTAGFRTVFSSSVYIVGYSSAAKYYGDGSSLTGVVSTDAVRKAGDTMTGPFTLNGSSLTVTGVSGLTISAALQAGEDGIVISTGGAIQTTGRGYGSVNGNSRGLGAVDLQTNRGVAAQVASGQYSAIGGGGYNTASGLSSTVGGGNFNTATNGETVVAGGSNNAAIGFRSTVGGGGSNTAAGQSSVVPGGEFNMASGEYSFAAGFAATATARGSFVWADSQAGGLLNTTTDQFLVRVQGGFNVVSPTSTFSGSVGIGTSTPVARLHISSGAGETGDLLVVSTGTSDMFRVNGSGNVTAYRFIGDGSLLSGVTDNTKVGRTGDIMTGVYTLANGTFSIANDGMFFSVRADGSLFSTGTYASGALPPAQGAGERFMWYPSRAAIRAGGVTGAGNWDDANLGAYSAAFGYNTKASGNYATAVGGYGNQATGLFMPFTGGGENNVASGSYAVEVGGQENRAEGDAAFIGGGTYNVANASYAVVSGGRYNVVAGTAAAVSGGANNTALGEYSVVSGGWYNNALGLNSFIGGGGYQTVDAQYGTVAGGANNKIRSLAYAAFIGGGENNISSGSYSTIGGGGLNVSSGVYSSVLGGFHNAASSYTSVVAGGNYNSSESDYSTVGGGNYNSAKSIGGVVGGGQNNTALGAYNSTVAGGNMNNASADRASVGGGEGNKASGDGSTIAGGSNNKASGGKSAIPGGYLNNAYGMYSFAAGYQSTSTADGTFTWKDSQTDSVNNDVMDQVRFKARGGFWVSTSAFYSNPGLFVANDNSVGIGTNSPSERLHVSGGNILLDNDAKMAWGIIPAPYITANDGSDLIAFGLTAGEKMKLTSASFTVTNASIVISTTTGSQGVVFQDGSVQNSAASRMFVKYKPIDSSITNDSVADPDPDLKFFVGPNEKWIFEFVLYVYNNDSGFTTDFKAGLTGPAAPTSLRAEYNFYTYDGVSSASGGVYSAYATRLVDWTGGPAETRAVIKGSIEASGVGGDLSLVWAQNTAGAWTTGVRAGSYLIAHQAK